MLELIIRQKLIDYLQNAISLDEFQEWFVPNTWDIHLSGEPGAIALTNDIELRLSEYSSGHLPEAQMRREFSQLLSYATLTLGSVSSSPRIQASSSSESITWQVLTPVAEGQSRSFGTVSVEVHA